MAEKDGSNTVAYLSRNDGETFLETICADYTRPKILESFMPNKDMYLFEMDGKSKEDDELRQLFLQPRFFDTELPNEVGRELLADVCYISKRYVDYKKTKDIDAFLDLYQRWVDIISTLCTTAKTADSIVGLAFLVNIVTKNGFFQFVTTTGSNVNVKILRNVREHNNVILNQAHFAKHYNTHETLRRLLHYHFSLHQLETYKTRIASGELCILFDMNTKSAVSALVVEETLPFLKKIITLSHIILFCCRLRDGRRLADRLVLSREIYSEYWSKKYVLGGLHLQEMRIDEHIKALHDRLQAVPEAELLAFETKDYAG